MSRKSTKRGNIHQFHHVKKPWAKSLRNINEDEARILNDILSILNGEKIEKKIEILTKLFNGAQVHLKGEHYYHRWKTGKHFSRENLSSHDSNKAQYSVRGAVVIACLVGTRKDENGDIHTWFQFERHQVGGSNIIDFMINTIAHLCNWILYRFTGKNIGPHGSSQYTDNNPFFLEKNLLINKPKAQGMTNIHPNLGQKLNKVITFTPRNKIINNQEKENEVNNRNTALRCS